MENFEKEIADIIGLRNGDTNAFNRLYKQYHKQVHANILKLIKSPERSAEILQDVFTSLWQNRNKLNTEKRLGGWLFVVSYNMSMSFIRKKLKESLVLVEEYPYEICDNTDQKEEDERYEMQMYVLNQAVCELPKRKREVFQMCRYEGKSKKDVADNLGLSLRTVDNYLKDANKMVRESIEKKYPAQLSNIGFVLLATYFL